ncbi:MAG TPA: hypothetical protein VHA82_06025 [Ramlibacter sp.]|uniref:hypothetical protein n=1 Tax=Ramlibacter sp. TaxID=1917967 RepID=UPI002C12ACAA|nr:hypothetical protein [Ramlibacter sp.]HVZ43350.1 hypothetical protein [Ramlibacter sp.]
MKKLILAAAAAAAVAAAAPVFAQGAECQAGSAYGTPAGCPSNGTPPALTYNSGSPVFVPGYPTTVVPQYDDSYANGVPYAYDVPRSTHRYRHLHRTRNDRDGDGVVNWQDRYPDDSRWR